MNAKTTFPPVPSASLDAQEQATQAFWKDEKIFQQTIEKRSPQYPFTFFDGPPFATGLPHYGHILAGTIKDAIPRYKTMQGYRVARNFGWDCHGVPVEFQVEKENKIGGRPGIEAMGVGPFNELCRSIVQRCSTDWEKTVDRMGRFVDFQNDYRTMDPTYIESVWWVFGQLWEKGLIYEGEKVIAYSPKLASPLSNFEAGLNYKDIDDPAVTVRFLLEDGTYALAWTTTPWTLPSNCALGFGRDMTYALVPHEGEKYWVAETLISKFFAEDAEVLERREGKDFLNLKYTPLFDFFTETDSPRFVCLHDDGDYVSAESGTGIVHFAPSFGAEDAELCAKFGVVGVNPIDQDGRFTSDVPPLAGIYFRKDETVPDSVTPSHISHEGAFEMRSGEMAGEPNQLHGHNANEWVLDRLKATGQLFKREQIRHSYPHCWRTECALMYRGIKTWFVDIQRLKPDLIKQAKNINWVPGYLKEGRFGKGLETAPDWAISRNRYWGAPMPVWRCDVSGHIEVISSKEQLEEKSGAKVDDLHRHFVDDLTWKSPQGGTMRRIPEVLDCWFESGSMPYASKNYPFSGTKFQPADFIAEGLDQTRCWFYNLHVLGVALMGENVYKNVITNGIVLAEDGTKMSKSKQNYPDPNEVFAKYGADAVRYYLLSSPAVRGENLRFTEKGVEEVLKSVLLPLQNAYQFMSTYANIDGWQPGKITAVRHGEGEHNVQNVYSGFAENEHHLTEKGRAQVRNTAKELTCPDVIIASPFVRTRETAAILAEELGFTGEIIIDDRIAEPFFGDLEGGPLLGFAHREAHPTTEKQASVIRRVKEFYEEVSQKYAGKHVIAVGHGETTRALHAVVHRFSDSTKLPYIDTAGYYALHMAPQPTVELDQWILGEAQTLLGHMTEKLDGYDIEGALRPVAGFVDQLTNWYIRRSRRRFWADGITQDKHDAYTTLHHILWTLSLTLAPVMPFFAERMYGWLGGIESVHLQPFLGAKTEWVNTELQASVAATREIVRLASSIRSRETIKLRQPLASVQFQLTSDISVDEAVIAAEANVKVVTKLTDTKGIAEKIVRIDARQVGRHFGKKTQDLIQAGKAGEFIENDDGSVTILGEMLTAGQFAVGYICADGVEAEACPIGVVLLDTTITPELMREGLVRDFIRQVQDARKANGFAVEDRIAVQYYTEDETMVQALLEHAEMIQSETLMRSFETAETPQPHAVEGASISLVKSA